MSSTPQCSQPAPPRRLTEMGAAQPGAGRSAAAVGGALARLIARILAWRPAGRQRLPAHLSDHALRDIGIERAAVEPHSTVAVWRLR